MTPEPSVFTAHDIPDLLNSVPTLFGFRPSESLVGVATHGPRRRLGFRLRVDIPAPEHVDEVARMAVGHLRRNGAEGAIFLAVTREQDVARDLLAAVERELGEIQVVVAARADGERYWSDEPGFPPEGIAYETSEHHLSIVQAVAAGQQILPDREALVARFAPPTGDRRVWLVRAADTVLAQVVPVVARTPDHEVADVGMRVVGPIVDRAMAGESLDDGDLVTLSVWMSTISVRDAVWGRIDRAGAEQMLTLLTRVSRVAVEPFEPAVLSLAAFAAWLTGDGAQALIAVERALRADPSYSMAGLILAMLEGGLNPSCWTGFEAERTA